MFYYCFYHLTWPRKTHFRYLVTLVVAVPLLLMSMFTYEILLGSEDIIMYHDGKKMASDVSNYYEIITEFDDKIGNYFHWLIDGRQKCR